MTCPKCKENTVFDQPFMRMNAFGEIGIFWCEPCAKKHEPELYANEKEDETPVEKDLKSMFYPNKKP